MYKLLLVTDRNDVLSAYERIDGWERLGFRPPHIRHDLEGMKDSLAKHHADGIAIAVNREERERIIAYLWEHFPYLSIFKAGTTPEEVKVYLNELKLVLNRLRADFSSDSFNEHDVMLECRHDLFRKLLSGELQDEEKFFRHMRLLRSRMDSDRPCVLASLEQSAGEDALEGRWDGEYRLLERTIKNSFTRDKAGFHICPLVTDKGRIFVLAGPLHGQVNQEAPDTVTEIIRQCVEDGIAHVRQYQGVSLRMTDIQYLPSLNSLCKKG